MTFADLPDKWETRPLTDSTMNANVVDLLLSLRNRMDCGLLVQPCDESFVAIKKVYVLDHVDWYCTGQKRIQTCDALDRLRVPAVLVAISAPRPIPREVAGRWYNDWRRWTAERDTALLGFYTASVYPERVRPFSGQEPKFAAAD